MKQAAASTAAAGGPLPVGIGIHAGETEDSAEGFVGSAVNIAARVCALAGPGELLVTETVRALVRTSMPLAMQPRGRRHLKGIREPIALFAIRPTGAAPLPRSRRLRSAAARSLERRPWSPPSRPWLAWPWWPPWCWPSASWPTPTPTGGQPGPREQRLANPTASASDNTFPNAAEQALLDRIDPAIARLCERAATSDSPRFAGLNEQVQLPVRAGLRCAMGGSQPDVVFLLRVSPTSFGGAATSEFWFGLRKSLAGAQIGDCSTNDNAYADWSFGLLAGKLLCVATPTRARIDWIYDGEDLIVWALREDADREALYRWWLDVGRVLLQ